MEMFCGIDEENKLSVYIIFYLKYIYRVIIPSLVKEH